MLRSFVALSFLTSTAIAADLRVGVAVTDITPPVGYRMAGNYQEKLATGTHDPLFAKAIVFHQNEQKLCWLVCDVCGVSRELTNEIRSGASKATGIPAIAIAVSATHTHAGPMHYDPVFLPLFRERYGAKSDADDPKEIDSYRKKFVQAGILAIVNAHRSLRPATLEVGEGELQDVAFNRRFHMKDGTVRFNPGKMNPGIVREAGPTNPKVPSLRIREAESKKSIAMLSTFDMHTAVFGGTKWGACYPGHLQSELQKSIGSELVSLFGEGCAGDVNHINVRTKDADFDSAAIGQKLAAVITKSERLAINSSLGFGSKMVTVDLKPSRKSELTAMKDRLIGPNFTKVPFLDQVEASQVYMTEYLRHRDGEKAKLEVQAFRLSADLAIVFLPHEIFVELGMDLKRRSPFPQTMVVSLANDMDCYVPTRKAFGEGSYEVTNSPYAPGVGEKLVDTAVEMLKTMWP